MKQSSFYAFCDLEIGDEVTLFRKSGIYYIHDICVMQLVKSGQVYFKFLVNNNPNDNKDSVWVLRVEIAERLNPD